MIEIKVRYQFTRFEVNKKYHIKEPFLADDHI